MVIWEARNADTGELLDIGVGTKPDSRELAVLYGVSISLSYRGAGDTP